MRCAQGDAADRRTAAGENNAREVTEYEINTALIESLNSVEKRAAIETGQEVDRADINLRGSLAAEAAVLQKAFTLDELEVIEARIEAAQNGRSPKELEAPAVVPDVKPVPDKTYTQDRNRVAATETVDQAYEGKPDPAGDGRTGRGTEPGKLPGKPGFASATSTRCWGCASSSMSLCESLQVPLDARDPIPAEPSVSGARHGKGIDPKVLDGGGRAGHHGLPGCNERAQLAGGKGAHCRAVGFLRLVRGNVEAVFAGGSEPH